MITINLSSGIVVESKIDKTSSLFFITPLIRNYYLFSRTLLLELYILFENDFSRVLGIFCLNSASAILDFHSDFRRLVCQISSRVFIFGEDLMDRNLLQYNTLSYLQFGP